MEIIIRWVMNSDFEMTSIYLDMLTICLTTEPLYCILKLIYIKKEKGGDKWNRER